MERTELIQVDLLEKTCKIDYKEVYVFGAGKWARIFLERLGDRAHDLLKGIIVQNKEGNPDSLLGVKVFHIDEIIKNNDIGVIVAVENNAPIFKLLKENGFINVLYVGNFMEMLDDDSIDKLKKRDNDINGYWEYFRIERPLFRYVEIETLNRCNGTCSFCPVNVNEKQRPYRKMDNEMFYDIINQLAEAEYDGLLALFSNNEPFLDERICDFAKHARNRLPKAFIYLITNGTRVTLDIFKEIIPQLDHCIFDNYTSSQMPPNVSECQAYCEQMKIMDKFTYWQVPNDTIRSSRGGKSPNGKVSYGIKWKCPLPFVQMVIRPDGKVSLCCNDALGENTLGDLTKESMVDIWYGEAFDDIRKKMIVGRNTHKTCEYCNYIDGRKIWESSLF